MSPASSHYKYPAVRQSGARGRAPTLLSVTSEQRPSQESVCMYTVRTRTRPVARLAVRSAELLLGSLWADFFRRRVRGRRYGARPRCYTPDLLYIAEPACPGTGRSLEYTAGPRAPPSPSLHKDDRCAPMAAERGGAPALQHHVCRCLSSPSPSTSITLASRRLR